MKSMYEMIKAFSKFNMTHHHKDDAKSTENIYVFNTPCLSEKIVLRFIHYVKLLIHSFSADYSIIAGIILLPTFRFLNLLEPQF